MLSVLPGVLGAVFGLWGLWRPAHPDSELAAKLAHAVLEAETAQFKQLLGGDRQALNGPINLAFSLVDAHGVEGAADEGTLKAVADYYSSLRPRRLVITGAATRGGRRGRGNGTSDAGAGKTVLAIKLMLDLARDRGEKDPVPVRLAAGAWPGTPLRDWLRAHLVSTYRLTSHEARRLVDGNLVLPVIDGLDEMDMGAATTRAAQLLGALERYERAGQKAHVVVTCRHDTYDALLRAGKPLQMSVRVQIAPVTPDQILDYLRLRVGASPASLTRWQPVLDDITPPPGQPQARSALASKLGSPWRLTLAAVVYEEPAEQEGFLRDPADLVSLARRGDLYRHLLDRYVKAAVNASQHDDYESDDGSSGHSAFRRRGRRLDPAKTWRYLAALARYLNASASREPVQVAGRRLSGTDIVLHELWPLGRPVQVMAVNAVMVFVLLQPGWFTTIWMGALTHHTRTAGAVVAVLSTAAVVRAGWLYWPQPRRVDFRRLRHRALWPAYVLALAVGIAGGYPARHTVGGPWAITLGVLNAAFFLVFCATAFGGATNRAPTLPGMPLRDDAVGFALAGFGYGLGQGLFSGLGWGMHGHGLAVGLWVGASEGLLIAIGFALGGGPGAATLRYVALVLSTRGVLPWRPAAFLAQCHRLGLLRTAGIAYQFRQRELQDHLATRPAPPPRIY
ncbi:NACHT domain-containing protein [Streptomyces sp. NPDC093984]|uniref:NACHT domain-containing protein n=1 Tax=Streptomyces sp. NPDC093984 TaxID=3366052 RepID=UPI00381F5E98